MGDGGAPGGPIFTGSTTLNDFACVGATGTIIDCGLSATGTNNWTALQNLNGGATVATRSVGDNTTNVANTAFVTAALNSGVLNIIVGTTAIGSGTPNGLLYDSAGVVGNLATLNSGVLVTSGGGVPSISTTLPSGLTIPGYLATGGTTVVNDIVLWNSTNGTAVKDAIGYSIAPGGPLAINPTAATTNQGLVVTQSSPTSGSVSGPLYYNRISVNNQTGVTGSGSVNGQLSATARAFDATMQSGVANESGNQIAGSFQMLHTLGNAGTATDRIAMFAVAYSNKIATGGGFLQAIDAAALADTGSTYQNLVGMQLETGVAAGATISERIGLEVTNDYASTGSAFDAAIAIDNNVSAGAFQKMIALGSPGVSGGTALATTADLFFANSALTLANGFNLPNVTFTGNFLNLPHTQITGTGRTVLAANGAALAAGPAGTTQLQVSGGDGVVTNVLADSFGTLQGAYYYSRAARGTAALPTALQANDTIGGLAFAGYGATGYGASRAGYFCFASQNWNDTNQGTYCTFGTVPNNSAGAPTVRGRIENDGGLMWPDTVAGGSKGAGTINATTYYVGGSQALLPISYVSPLSYNGGTGAVSISPSPTFATSVTTPLVLGGAAVGSSLTLQSTSAAGTTDFIDVLVGNNGGTRAARILDSGCIAVASTTDCGAGHLTIGAAINTANPLQIFGSSASSGSTVKIIASDNTTSGASGVEVANSTVGVDILFIANAAARTTTRWGLTIGNYAEIGDFGNAANGLILGEFGAGPVIIGANNAEVVRFLSAGNMKFSNAANFTASGAVATSLGSIGPTGSHTTVQTWLTFVDNTGATRYVPAF
jgi:hypothetical protein